MQISDDEFNNIVSAEIDNIPKRYLDKLDNIAFVVEDVPSAEQRQKLKLHPYQTLFGLYEGAPLTARFGQTKMLPDKITIFKIPLINASSSIDDLKKKVGHTVWHEVAHYYGLDHGRIDYLDNQSKDTA